MSELGLQIRGKKIHPALLAGPALVFTGMAVYLLSETVKEKVADIISERRILKLHPLIRDKTRAFINDAKRQGYNVKVTSGLRTWAKQADLYAKGRTAAGKIVTYAVPGSSFHNYGLAIDIVEYKDGKPWWKSPNWNTLGMIGKIHGFEWGGDWRKPDKPHFQMRFAKSTSRLKMAYKAGKLVNGYVDILKA